MVINYAPKKSVKQHQTIEKLSAQEKELIDKLLINKKQNPEEIRKAGMRFQKQVQLYKIYFNQSCIDFSKLSKEYKQVFQAAGIKKKELQNMETALKIYELILVKQNEKPIVNPVQNKKFTTSMIKKDTEGTQFEEKKLIDELKNTPSKSSLFRKKSGKKEISIHEDTEQMQIPVAPTIQLQPVVISTPKQNNQQIQASTSIKPQENLGSSQQNNRDQILQQIQQGKFKLRHVDMEEEEKIRQAHQQQEISSVQANDLTYQLAQVINARRLALNKYNKSDSESSSGWNDSD